MNILSANYIQQPKRTSRILRPTQISSFSGIVALLSLGVAACGSVDDPNPGKGSTNSVSYEVGTCTFTPPVGVSAECGTVTVPENPSKPDGLTIKLAVMLLKTPGTKTAPPLLNLPGGPGGSAIGRFELTDAQSVAQGRALMNFAKQRDVIVYDPRGTGKSTPVLMCNEREANDQCYARLGATGIDFSQYTTNANADDADAVRKALGYDQMDILGGSYGTRVALEILRRHPNSVRAAIIDSVVPAQIDMLAETQVAIYDLLKATLERCAADSACAAAYPNLESKLQETIENLSTTPGSVTLDGGPTIPVDVQMFMGMLTGLVREAATLATVPRFILKAYNKDYSLIKQSMQNRPSSSASTGVYNSVICAEEAPYTSAEKIASVHATRIPDAYRVYFSERRLDDCRAWSVPAAPASANEAVKSDKPVLVLTGTADAATPPSWAKLAAESLPKSHYLEFVGVGHVTFRESECAEAAVSQFLMDPATKPAAACQSTLAFPPFDLAP